MDLPLELLKDVSQAIPVQQGAHSLTWDPEIGYQLHVNVNGKFMPFRFDYGETVNDLKEQIEAATGVTLPSKEKKKEGEKVETPIMDNIPKQAGLDFLSNVLLNPKTPELNQAFALYEKKTGNSRNDMTNADIGEYVRMIRAQRQGLKGSLSKSAGVMVNKPYNTVSYRKVRGASTPGLLTRIRKATERSSSPPAAAPAPTLTVGEQIGQNINDRNARLEQALMGRL